MISRGYGRLVYLTAGLSRRPRKGMITLGAAKAALDQFVRFVALELARTGSPPISSHQQQWRGTAMTQHLTQDQMDSSLRPPMGRLVRPDDVAKAVAFLASEDSGLTTGHYLPVNGGLAMD